MTWITQAYFISLDKAFSLDVNKTQTIMKTQVFTQNQSLKTFGFIAAMLALFAFHPIYGQTKSPSTEVSAKERSVSGIVDDANGPLANVNVIQKGTRHGTVTNDKGEFKFPVKLKSGDVLVFSYLGYEKQDVYITDDTSFIEITLKDVNVEMIGALDSNTPYKSKRKKN